MAEKNKGGRPSKYEGIDIKQAEKLSRLGATDAEIADFYGVHVDTIYEWKKVHAEFSDALKRGKLFADGEIADSLYKRARGFRFTETKTTISDMGSVTTKTTKFIPPDTTAGIFWLKNRQPGKWRDKQEVEHSGQTAITIKETRETDEEASPGD